jgi:hypothetical protein
MKTTTAAIQIRLIVSFTSLLLLLPFMVCSQVVSPNIGSQIIRPLPQAEFQKIREFQVINSNQDTVMIEATLQNFKLRENENFAVFPIDETILSLENVPEDASIIPEAYFVRDVEHNTHIFQFLLSEKESVAFDGETESASGSIIVQAIKSDLENLDQGQMAIIKLAEPIVLMFHAPGVSDQTIYIHQLNWPPVTVLFNVESGENYPKDHLKTKMLSIFEPEGFETILDVKPYVEITIDKKSIQGFGIQQCPVKFTMYGSSQQKDYRLGIGASKGYFEHDTVTITSGVTSVAYLRSEGVGGSIISIDGIAFIEDSVYFSFPWSFLLFSIIGAVIGSLIRIFRAGKKPFDTRSFIVGVLLGFTVAVCYWALGLDLLNLDLNIGYINEFAVIALSILGGLFGGYIGRSKQ